MASSAAAAAQAPAASAVPQDHTVRAALVRGLPSSFASGLKMHAPGEPIDMALADRQHDAYTRLLRRLVPRVVEVAVDDSMPDCVFIEDTAVVTPCGIAIVTRPGECGWRGAPGLRQRAPLDRPGTG
jgi:hypothetical protein